MEIIEWLKNSIGKEPVEFWGRIGFLDNIYDKAVKEKIAKAYSEFGEWIANNPDKRKYAVPSLNINFEVCFLIAVLSVIRVYPDVEITNVEDVYNYIVWYYYNYLDYYLGKLKHQKFDWEAQICSDISESIIKELKEKKNE